MTEEELDKECANIEIECYRRIKNKHCKHGYVAPILFKHDPKRKAIEDLYSCIIQCKLQIIKLKNLK